MLTSAGQPDDVAHCRELGIDAALMKPLKQSELLNVIIAALTRSPHNGAAPEPAPVAPPARRPLRVLLAEDNEVNQRLAVRLLEKQGHTVVVARNGKEAVAALQEGAFDLVLMDVQMPEVDGFEATAHIRRAEAGSGRRVPILAMTAHAMKGDRERCLQAGMDGYISKPVQPQELFDAVDRVSPPAAETVGAASRAAPADAADNALDTAELMHRVEGDVALMKELVRVYLDTYPGRVAELRQALARGDAAAVRRAAHTLKGMVGQLGARAASAAAQRLEAMGRERNLTQAGAACAALEAALERVRPALARLLGEGDGP